MSCALYLYLPLEVTVRLANTSYTVSESDGFVNLTVVREGLSSQTVSITLTTTNGSALGEPHPLRKIDDSESNRINAKPVSLARLVYARFSVMNMLPSSAVSKIR